MNDHEPNDKYPHIDDRERFASCPYCFEQLPSGESHESYARLSITIGPRGFIVRCVRHDDLIVFECDHERLARIQAGDMPPTACDHDHEDIGHA